MTSIYSRIEVTQNYKIVVFENVANKAGKRQTNPKFESNDLRLRTTNITQKKIVRVPRYN